MAEEVSEHYVTNVLCMYCLNFTLFGLSIAALVEIIMLICTYKVFRLALQISLSALIITF